MEFGTNRLKRIIKLSWHCTFSPTPWLSTTVQNKKQISLLCQQHTSTEIGHKWYIAIISGYFLRSSVISLECSCADLIYNLYDMWRMEFSSWKLIFWKFDASQSWQWGEFWKFIQVLLELDLNNIRVNFQSNIRGNCTFNSSTC